VSEAPLRILLLTSDWKWTGPAEPMLELAAGLRERGHAVDVACPEAPPGEERGVAIEARRRGLAPALEVGRGRGEWWLRDAADARRLRALVAERGYDVVHAYHTRDHALALRAAGWASPTGVARSAAGARRGAGSAPSTSTGSRRAHRPRRCARRSVSRPATGPSASWRACSRTGASICCSRPRHVSLRAIRARACW
jgi:hypothetical protein